VTETEIIKSLQDINASNSAKGLGLGFLGNIISLMAGGACIVLMPDKTEPKSASDLNASFRAMMAFNSVWLTIFCIPAILRLLVRPAKPLDSGYGPGIHNRILDYGTIGYRRTFNTLKSLGPCGPLKQFGVFILAFVVYSGEFCRDISIFASCLLTIIASFI
jgi:MFS-type transporter involved in bile tolerance (Atg22 family)